MNTPDLNRLESYDFTLPENLIARYPLQQRDASRLLVLDRKTGEIQHQQFQELPLFLQAGDCLVLNQTRVLAARILGVRESTGGKWEGLFLKAVSETQWEVLSKTRGKLQEGEWISITPVSQQAEATLEPKNKTLRLKLIEKTEQGGWFVEPLFSQDDSPSAANPQQKLANLLARFGTMPLPPYIGRTIADDSDWERYQTTYANSPGAVAAPTAGLHFTPELLEQCQQAGVKIVFVTLHVGIGTFRPISAENLNDHSMHEEWCEVSQESADIINETQSQGGRIFAVGTTSVRTLEAAAAASGFSSSSKGVKGGQLLPFCGETNLFIKPGYQFQIVDCLITNFHLPCSSLLVMISALAGYQHVRTAYERAIESDYRFFSYGDAMLIK